MAVITNLLERAKKFQLKTTENDRFVKENRAEILHALQGGVGVNAIFNALKADGEIQCSRYTFRNALIKNGLITPKERDKK